MALHLRTSEIEHQFIEERINFVEYLMSELSTQFSSYNRNIAHQRDSGDRLAKTVLKLASKEVLNPTLRFALGHFSDIIRAVQDYREAEVQRLDHRVILEFSSYGPYCKQAKEQLKKSFSTRARELTKKGQLDKIRAKKPTNWQQINQAEREADKARSEANLATFHLSQEIDSFEKKKLEDMKRILLDFINIELLFHVKALELYTSAYQVIEGIKPEDDLNEFRNHFRFPLSSPNKDVFGTPESGDACTAPKHTPAKVYPPREVRLSETDFEKTRLSILSPIPECGSSSSSDLSYDSSVSEETTDSKKMNIFRKIFSSRKDY